MLAQDLESLPSSRRTLGRAKRAKTDAESAYGSMLKEVSMKHKKNGRDVKFTVLNPAGILARALKESTAFRDTFMAAYAHKPPTVLDPWGLLLY